MDAFWVEDGGQAYTPRTYRKAKRKLKFDGWGSMELIQFLKSISKDTSKPLSHYDVTNIVNQYVIDCKLIHPEKKKRVICDERLQFLFGGKKQSVLRNKIHDLLEPHLVANHVDSEEDRSSSEDYEGDASVSKKPKFSTSDKTTLPRKKRAEVPKSSLAAICPENMKLVYLKRSLVLELLRYPQTFEIKIVGSFVKTKSDPYDIYQKNSHQLQLVTGVKEVVSSGDNRSAVLQIANMSESVNISALSDDNFSEDECEDLHRRIKDGLLKHPTVGELERTAIILHEDITKHWLARELVLLKIRTDQANEKGWRHRVMEYTDRRKLLETPAEQARLLNEIPVVLPVKVEKEISPDDSPDYVNQSVDDPPKDDDWDWEPCSKSSSVEASIKISSMHSNQEQRQIILDPVEEVGTRTNGDARPLNLNKAISFETMQVKTYSNKHINPMEQSQISSQRTEAPTIEINYQAESINPVQKQVLNAGVVQAGKGRDASAEDPTPKKVEVITLSDDEDGPEIPSKPKPALSNLEHFPWHYLDPTGRVQGPFSLVSLKRWSDLGYFQPGFRVWMSGQRPEDAVLLSSVLQHVFPR